MQDSPKDIVQEQPSFPSPEGERASQRMEQVRAAGDTLRTARQELASAHPKSIKEKAAVRSGSDRLKRALVRLGLFAATAGALGGALYKGTHGKDLVASAAAEGTPDQEPVHDEQAAQWTHAAAEALRPEQPPDAVDTDPFGDPIEAPKIEAPSENTGELYESIIDSCIDDILREHEGLFLTDRSKAMELLKQKLAGYIDEMQDKKTGQWINALARKELDLKGQGLAKTNPRLAFALMNEDSTFRSQAVLNSGDARLLQEDLATHRFINHSSDLAHPDDDQFAESMDPREDAATSLFRRANTDEKLEDLASMAHRLKEEDRQLFKHMYERQVEAVEESIKDVELRGAIVDAGFVQRQHEEIRKLKRALIGL